MFNDNGSKISVETKDDMDIPETPPSSSGSFLGFFVSILSKSPAPSPLPISNSPVINESEPDNPKNSLTIHVSGDKGPHVIPLITSPKSPEGKPISNLKEPETTTALDIHELEELVTKQQYTIAEQAKTISNLETEIKDLKEALEKQKLEYINLSQQLNRQIFDQTTIAANIRQELETQVRNNDDNKRSYEESLLREKTAKLEAQALLKAEKDNLVIKQQENTNLLKAEAQREESVKKSQEVASSVKNKIHDLGF